MSNGNLPDVVANLIRRNALLEKENFDLRRVISKLSEEVSDLKFALAVAQKNSRNSSKPPSSDITKPQARKRGGKKRKIGAQPGP
jgi:hypothetical protein